MNRTHLALCLTTGVVIPLAGGGTLLTTDPTPDVKVEIAGDTNSANPGASEATDQVSVDVDATSTLPAVMASLDDTDDTTSYWVVAIFDGQKNDKSSAVIVTNEGEVGQYHRGDILPTHHRLHAIFPERVMIDDGRALQTVHLSSRAYNHSPDQQGPPPVATAASITRSFSLIKPEHFSPDNLIENRETLLKLNDLTPVSDTSPLGYIIGDRFYPKLLDEIGAEPGDTIVSVNGYNVGNEAGDLQAAESFLRTGSAFMIILTQEGRNLMLEYP